MSDEAAKPQASTVISLVGDVSVSTADNSPRVRLDFGGAAVFFSPADAHLIGAQMIATAARLQA